MLNLSGIHIQPVAPVNESFKAIEAAIAYMHLNPAKTINLHRLASFVDMDPFYLSHLFTKYTGLNLKHFHQLVRLKAAKRILAETPLSVTDVALECGYDSLGTFASMFKKAVGLTPTEFRTFANRSDLPYFSPNSSKLPSKSNNDDEFHFICIDAPDFSRGVVFIALCGSSDGLVLNCTSAPFEGKMRLTIPKQSTEPQVALAAFYSSNTTFKSAVIYGPNLVGRSCVIVGPEVDLTLRPPAIIDPPLIAALPILAVKRALEPLQPRESRSGNTDSLASK